MKTLRNLAVMFVMAMTFMLTGISADAAGVVQTAQTQNAVTVMWQQEDDALEYYVAIGDDYTAASSAQPVTVPASVNSYTFRNLKPGTQYYVKITYKYQSSYSGTIYTYPLGSTDIKTLPGKVTNVNQHKWWYYSEYVDVAWDDQTGVDGFEYTVKDSKKRTYLKNASVGDGCSFKVKNNMVYSITVRAYSMINGQKYYGEESATAYLFTQPMVKSAKISAGQLKIKWNKVNGVTGYDVYVSTKEKSGYKKVKSLKKSATSLTVKKLKGKKFKANKKYYVYIVAKKKVGKRTYTSGRHYTYEAKYGRLNWTFD